MNLALPSAWDDGWKRQTPQEAASGIYTNTLALLRLPMKVEKSIFHVALFTTATQLAYELVVQKIGPEGSGRT